jgi:Zn-finger nucleic acid-binding protein
MSVEISFCPLCAGKLDSGNNDKFVCDDCETRFLIQVVEDDDDEDDEEDEEDEDDENEDDDEEDDEADDEDEY